MCSSQVTADRARMLDTVVFIGSADIAKRVEQVLWPAHCVQKSDGAALHGDLILLDNAIHVYKGTNPEIDSYSAFWDNMKLSKTTLDSQLKERFVTDVYVVGLATDVCVGTCSFLSKVEQENSSFSVHGSACVGARLPHGIDRRCLPRSERKGDRTTASDPVQEWLHLCGLDHGKRHTSLR